VYETPRQAVGDRIDVALLNLAEPRLDGRHGVYQWTQKIAQAWGLVHLFALSWTLKIL
jgi:hypothetical protein